MKVRDSLSGFGGGGGRLAFVKGNMLLIKDRADANDKGASHDDMLALIASAGLPL